MANVKPKDVHKLFKQALLSRRCVTEDLAGVLWKKCEEAARSLNEEIPSQYTPDEVGTYIQEINDTLAPLSIEFKTRIDEVTGKRMWALVNLIDGEIAQSATDYTPIEISYFKQLLELIILAPSDAFSVSSLSALREVSNLKNTMSKAQAESALTNFVAKGWLYKSARGRYGLSSRSLLELEIYLRNTFPEDVIYCQQCSELCTIGVACSDPTGGCRTYLHRHCFEVYRLTQNKCMACQADWARPAGVRKFGEDSVPEGTDDSLRRRFRRDEESSGEGTEDEEEEEAPPPPPEPKKRGKLQRKSQLTQNDEDEEEAQEMEVEDDEDDLRPSRFEKGKGRKR